MNSIAAVAAGPSGATADLSSYTNDFINCYRRVLFLLFISTGVHCWYAHSRRYLVILWLKCNRFWTFQIRYCIQIWCLSKRHRWEFNAVLGWSMASESHGLRGCEGRQTCTKPMQMHVDPKQRQSLWTWHNSRTRFKVYYIRTNRMPNSYYM